MQKTQAEYDELYFISDINIISWFRDMKLCLTDVAVQRLKAKMKTGTWESGIQRNLGEKKKQRNALFEVRDARKCFLKPTMLIQAGINI